MIEPDLNMPPLPEPLTYMLVHPGCVTGLTESGFNVAMHKALDMPAGSSLVDMHSADQMREYALYYARAAVLKERQEIADICDRVKEQRFASGNVREGSTARILAEIIRNRT